SNLESLNRNLKELHEQEENMSAADALTIRGYKKVISILRTYESKVLMELIKKHHLIVNMYLRSKPYLDKILEAESISGSKILLSVDMRGGFSEAFFKG